MIEERASGVKEYLCGLNFSPEDDFSHTLWHTLCITVKAIDHFYGSRMFSPLERRRFNRLIIPLPVRYQTFHPESGELHEGCGIIRDISLTGSFFHLDQAGSLHPGQLITLTISAPLPCMDIQQIAHFTAHGEVVRLEPPGPANPNYGVAVHFLEDLSFATA
jgi:PilZ domain